MTQQNDNLITWPDDNIGNQNSDNPASTAPTYEAKQLWDDIAHYKPTGVWPIIFWVFIVPVGLMIATTLLAVGTFFIPVTGPIICTTLILCAYLAISMLEPSFMVNLAHGLHSSKSEGWVWWRRPGSVIGTIILSGLISGVISAVVYGLTYIVPGKNILISAFGDGFAVLIMLMVSFMLVVSAPFAAHYATPFEAIKDSFMFMKSQQSSWAGVYALGAVLMTIYSVLTFIGTTWCLAIGTVFCFAAMLVFITFTVLTVPALSRYFAHRDSTKYTYSQPGYVSK